MHTGDSDAHRSLRTIAVGYSLQENITCRYLLLSTLTRCLTLDSTILGEGWICVPHGCVIPELQMAVVRVWKAVCLVPNLLFQQRGSSNGSSEAVPGAMLVTGT